MSDEQDKIGEAVDRIATRIANQFDGSALRSRIRRDAVRELAQVQELIRDVARIANESQLPDSDGVNVPTALWAEDWLRRFGLKENQ